MFLFIPVGLLDPLMCKEAKCNMIMAIKTNGRRKCNEKNRFRVAFPTENPPHSQVTIVFPKYGIADTRFVITVAPQKDICPHGRTYPMNAVPIITKIIRIPEIHTDVDLNDENNIPRLI